VAGIALDFVAENMTDVARAIQLALAPVFLLTGIAGLLNVMTNRLARIVDLEIQVSTGISRVEFRN
jgi:hypothetical protein